MSDTESELYARLGASSSKAGLHAVLDKLNGASASSFHNASTSKLFAQIGDDVAGDPAYFSLLHADSAGTKAILAYLAFRESGDVTWFKTLAQDSLVMNLDDVACVGALDHLMLNNTIARNRQLIPDAALEVIILEYRRLCEMLAQHQIKITMCGGETEDLGDVVRTLSVGSTLFTRSPRSSLIDTACIQSGDVIVGFSNTGQATYEDRPNSSIASNGITLARAALVPSALRERYPEICDPAGAEPPTSNCRPTDIFAHNAELGMPLIEALLSPTRTYAPLVKKLLLLQQEKHPQALHGLIHCTGGGQTKILRFGNNKRFIKDNLFKVPAIFSLIQSTINVPWKEMYSVFNMGHRLELVCPKDFSQPAIALAAQLGIQAQVIGRVEDLQPNQASELLLKSPAGEFVYKI